MLNWAREKDEDVAKGGGNSEASNALYRHILEYTDYQHGIRFAASRTGSVSGCFNPYIVVGYPMDIIDPSPDRPSYHALCTQVVHSISDGSISTSIGFSGAASYEQLYSMDFSMSLPWLSDLLGIKTGSDYDTTLRYISLIQEDSQRASDAQAAADRFYMEVLGVEAAMISELSSYKYEEPPEGAVPNPASAQNWRNSMAMARRSIQPMGSIEELGHKEFILKEEIRAAEAAQSVVKENMSPPSLNDGEKVITTRRRQMGYSLFLDYKDATIEHNPKALTLLDNAARDRTGKNIKIPVMIFPNMKLGWKGVVVASWRPFFDAMDAALRAKIDFYDADLQKEYGTPPLLFHSIIFKESSFIPGRTNPPAKNSTSPIAIEGVLAVGLTQVYASQFKNGGKVKGRTWKEVSSDSFINLEVGHYLLVEKLKSAKTQLTQIAAASNTPAPSAAAVLNTAILLYAGYGKVDGLWIWKRVADHLKSSRSRYVGGKLVFQANSLEYFPINSLPAGAADYLCKVLSYFSAADADAPESTEAPATSAPTVLTPILPDPKKERPKTFFDVVKDAGNDTLL